MKKLLWLIAILWTTYSHAATLNKSLINTTLHEIKKNKLDCTTDQQYFTIKHHYPSKDIVFYLQSENFNVESTLPSLEEFSNEVIYSNHFTHPKQSILTGAIHAGKILDDGTPSINTLCSITFACKFTPENGYNYHIVTNGVGCRIQAGEGTQEDPYVVYLK